MDATGPDSDKTRDPEGRRRGPDPMANIDQPIVVGDVVQVIATGWGDAQARGHRRWGRVVAFDRGAPVVDCGGDVGLVHAGHWRKANGVQPPF